MSRSELIAILKEKIADDELNYGCYWDDVNLEIMSMAELNELYNWFNCSPKI